MRMIRDNVERIANTDEQMKKLKEAGYGPMNPAEEKTTSALPKNEILEQMTVAELKVLAKGKDITGVSSLTKEELLEVLKGVV